jgi:hypothetical protein
MHTDDVLAKALAVASEWHGDQERKVTDTPYVAHLLGVASLVLEGGGTVGLHAPAALLHDVVEDTDATVSDVESVFGSEIAAIVSACRDKDDPVDPPPWIDRKARYVEHLLDVPADALLVSLADKVHNYAALDAARQTVAELEDLRDKKLDLDSYRLLESSNNSAASIENRPGRKPPPTPRREVADTAQIRRNRERKQALLKTRNAERRATSDPPTSKIPQPKKLVRPKRKGTP